MLYEQVEKREKEACGGITTATGSCKFCGQVATCKALEEWSQEEIDELATETCECVDARIYTHKKGQKERANARIDLLFGKDNKRNYNRIYKRYGKIAIMRYRKIKNHGLEGFNEAVYALRKETSGIFKHRYRCMCCRMRQQRFTKDIARLRREITEKGGNAD